jgi:hypothetical protein
MLGFVWKWSKLTTHEPGADRHDVDRQAGILPRTLKRSQADAHDLSFRGCLDSGVLDFGVLDSWAWNPAGMHRSLGGESGLAFRNQAANSRKEDASHMSTDAGRRWGSADKLEAYIRDRLVNFARFFRNHEDRPLPLMTVTIPGQFNESGHGIDILALDRRRTLWIIEVSRGSILGAGLVKHLGKRKDGNSQMSPEWRTQKADKFLALPDSTEKLIALFDAPGLPPGEARSLFASKLNEHRVAIVVPEGCHVEGQNTEISFGQDIYTSFVGRDIQLHTRRK